MEYMFKWLAIPSELSELLSASPAQKTDCKPSEKLEETIALTKTNLMMLKTIRISPQRQKCIFNGAEIEINRYFQE